MALGAGTAEGWARRGWVLFVCPDGCDEQAGPESWRFWCRIPGCHKEGIIERKKETEHGTKQ